MTTTDTLVIRWMPSSGTYAVAYINGTLIEHHIPTEQSASERLTFHIDRVRSLREWDDAHRAGEK